LSDDDGGFDRAWNAFPGRAALVDELGGDAELARAAFIAVGPEALAWLDRPIPALEGRAPRELLATRRGRREVRSLLARMPR
jgi:hypothetical protein